MSGKAHISRETVAFRDALSGFLVLIALILVPLASRLFSADPLKRGGLAAVIYPLYAVILVLSSFVLWTGARWLWARIRRQTTEENPQR